MKQPFAWLAAWSVALPLLAADLPSRGNELVAEYFRNETATLTARCLADIQTVDDWQANRDERRRHLQEMLGLSPMPERTDLQPVVTGKLEHDDFTVEKIHFQASPGLYCTANLYLPRKLEKPAPTILYECGHARSVTNGISFGNKAVYQVDGAWFARNGYVCLVLDTVLAGEIQGVHTGTRDRGMWWWNSRGYTPAGVEAWFGIRALDYLCTRPEVDTNRFGITGHSGGGAYSWTVTALDDRIKVAAPLAGMADAQSHIGDGVMDSHCDCNFFINTYLWDFPQLAALAAPRPLLIGGTDNDRLFNLENTLRIYDKVRRIYKLYNATDKLGLVIAPGPHDEVPELRLAVLRWFNRYLKGVEKASETPIVVDAKKFFTPEQLRVFTTLPADAINTNIAETFVPLAKNGLRTDAELTPSPRPGGERAGERGADLKTNNLLSSPGGGEGEKRTARLINQLADELRATLRERVFNGWPADDSPLDPKPAFSVERAGLKFSAWDFTSQPGVPLRLYFLELARAKPADRVQLTVFDDAGWYRWLGAMRTGFEPQMKEELAGGELPEADAVAFAELRSRLESGKATLAFIAPRGVGLTAFAGDEKARTKIRRRFMLLGQTLDGMRVWDIRRAVQMIHFVRDADVAKVELNASGDMAVNSLYASLFEPSVRRLELGRLPRSQADGPDYLNVLRVVDLPQVLEMVGTKAEVH